MDVSAKPIVVIVNGQNEPLSEAEIEQLWRARKLQELPEEDTQLRALVSMLGDCAPDMLFFDMPMVSFVINCDHLVLPGQKVRADADPFSELLGETRAMMEEMGPRTYRYEPQDEGRLTSLLDEGRRHRNMQHHSPRRRWDAQRDFYTNRHHKAPK